MFNFHSFKLNIVKRVIAIVVTVIITLAFGLYYIGAYDIALFERPEGWKNNYSDFISLLKGNSEEETTAPEETQSPETTSSDNGDHSSHASRGDGSQSTYKELVYDTVSNKSQEGYLLTDKVWDSSCILAKLEASVAWPSSISYGNKTIDKEVFTTHPEGQETTRSVEKETTQRIAVEMYMGYIIYDDCGTQYIMNSDGKILTKYDDSEYIPAYTRDNSGRPLFYKEYPSYVKYPTELGKIDENGNYEWEKTATINTTEKKYYYLAPDGVTFKESDYDDTTDNRGLYFDYPSYYGQTTSKLKRYYLNTTAVVTSLDRKNTSIVSRMNWMYNDDTDFTMDDIKITKDGYVLDKDETTGTTTDNKSLKTISDVFPYTKAYNYSEDYAAVMMDIEWIYYHEEDDSNGKKINKEYKVKTNELRIIDKTGKVMFNSIKEYFTVNDWTAFQRYSEPLSRSVDALGSYYFDHGLIRIRKQAFDRYYFTDLDSVFIVSDEDVLVNAKGEEFNIPSGYELVSYSNGVLLLKNENDYRYLSYTGSWVIDRSYSDAKPFFEGVAVCQNNEGLYGVITTTGEVIVPFRYNYISNISSGIIAAYSDSNGWTVFEKMSK